MIVEIFICSMNCCTDIYLIQYFLIRCASLLRSRPHLWCGRRPSRLTGFGGNYLFIFRRQLFIYFSAAIIYLFFGGNYLFIFHFYVAFNIGYLFFHVINSLAAISVGREGRRPHLWCGLDLSSEAQRSAAKRSEAQKNIIQYCLQYSS